jgi:hypothetical protein
MLRTLAGNKLGTALGNTRGAVISAAAICIAALAFAAGPLSAQDCSVATLNGDYAFTINGEIRPPTAPAPVPQQGVAMTHYDGAGNLTQVDFVMSNGAPAPYNPTLLRPDGFRTGETGTYTVNSDCTGTITINFGGGATAGGTTIDIRFVLADHGNEIREVVKSITTPAGEIFAAIIANGKKLTGGKDPGPNGRAGEDGVRNPDRGAGPTS